MTWIKIGAPCSRVKPHRLTLDRHHLANAACGAHPNFEGVGFQASAPLPTTFLAFASAASIMPVSSDFFPNRPERMERMQVVRIKPAVPLWRRRF
jgi:hypothetical protein